MLSFSIFLKCPFYINVQCVLTNLKNKKYEEKTFSNSNKSNNNNNIKRVASKDKTIIRVAKKCMSII